MIFTDTNLVEEIKKYGKWKTIQKDTILMSPGDEIVFVPIVEKGILRIVRQNEEGKEIFLYHLFPGQTCAMAINCCQTNQKSLVKAIAEEDTSVLLIPVNLIEDWFRYPQWKAFINNTYANRFQELMNVIDLIAFNHLDKQLLHYLTQRAKAAKSHTLNLTHQQIADELHTHREVISRLLRTMEDKNILSLKRNAIQLNFDLIESL